MTTRAQRVAIWVIGIVMVGGTLGAYFLVILENNTAQQAQTTPQTSNQSADPTAYKVSGPVTKLEITDLTVGDGAAAKAGDTVRVHYKGTIAQTGVKFQSSYDTGEPVTISLASTIQGWQDGIPGMKVGGKRRLVIPASEAYGATGTSDGTVPPNTDLVFEVELLAVNPPAAQ